MLHLHVAERADALVAALPDVLSDPNDDPFEPAVLAVPSRGVERWLTQTLSHHLGATESGEAGVAANIEFPFPETLVREAVSGATGFDPRSDPWTSARLVWPLLEVVDANADAGWLSLLAAHIGAAPGSDESRRKRRAAVVSHVGRLFASYAVNRPDMIRAWAEGADTDGSGNPLPPATAWQPKLWRRLRVHLDSPSPPERLAEACERLREDPSLAQLPQSISVFGLTRLPASQLEVLDALAAHRDVHLFVLHPSRALWDDLAANAPDPPAARRAEDTTLDRVANPLLASWGHDARELQLVLSGRDDATVSRHPTDHDTDSLLHRLQSQLSANEAPPGPPPTDTADQRPLLTDDDRSVQVHSCHGRERQVEVLRDAIMHLLAADPTLEPRDVIVMCPNVEDFAPLIHAAFGAGRLDPTDDELAPGTADAPAPPDLRVRLADRSLRRTNPILGAVAEILDLASARLTASELLDFANLEPVRHRFGFDDDDLSRINEWINAAHIHWGIDLDHRVTYQVPVDDGTWRRGLDRILLGVAMSEDGARVFGGTLPLDDVESGAISLAGRFAELLDRLDAAFSSFAEAKTLEDWAEELTAAADGLTATAFGAEWERLELDRLLEDLATDADAASPALTLPEFRALLAPRLAGRPTSANFRTGHISVCTMTPMRSVPHRVVCLLGLDDGQFPRKTPRDGDDLLLGEPHIGDRDPRLEDRQLLLDALMAATDNLVITYGGSDERTNVEIPPAVPVGELIDVIDATVRHPDPLLGAREQVVVTHPLQPFDPRNFTPEWSPTAPDPWSFDPVNLAGALAREETPEPRGPFLPEPLEPPAAAEGTPAVLELDDLLRFVEHPIRAFLMQRLGIGVRDFFEEVDDDLPIELDGLGKWGVGNNLLQAQLRGLDRRAATLAEIKRGTLPPSTLGLDVINEQTPRVDAILALAARELPRGERTSEDVRVELDGGRVLAGTVGGIEEGILGTVTLSRIKAKQRLVSWVRLLAVTAAHPDRDWQAVTVGRHPTERGEWVTRLCNLGDTPEERRATATAYLNVIADLHARGMRAPLPIYTETSAAYAAAARSSSGNPIKAAAKKFETERYSPVKGEIDDAEHRFVYGDISALTDVLGERPHDDEGGEGWFGSERTRFGRLARRLWDDLLRHEQGDRG
ncbi:MAG: exodeoxyribonuclease V subunit gamma [Solirubrobacterales bacterium]|nr:exodeoxyribonuclease V subunit gamma [Solirubrobacterales bacterium]